MGRDPIGACGNVDPSQSCPPIRPTHQHPRRPPGDEPQDYPAPRAEGDRRRGHPQARPRSTRGGSASAIDRVPPTQYQQLITWAERHGRVAAFGIEGTGSYGAGLARAVRRAGHQVLEVNRGDRRTRRIAGKSDTVDAETAARSVLAGQSTAIPKTADGAVEDAPPQGRAPDGGQSPHLGDDQLKPIVVTVLSSGRRISTRGGHPVTNHRTIQPHARKVIVSVDTHKHVHVAVAIDTWGIRLGDRSCAADSDGYQQLITWAERHGRVAAFGIEGTGSYGAGLARAVRRAGHQVLEVNRGDRRTRRIAGKSDTVDAETAARSVLAGQSTAIPKTADGAVEMMRHLKVARRTAVKARTSAMITLKPIVVTAPPALRETLHPLADQALLKRCRGWRCGTIDTPTASAKHTLRALARRWFALSVEIVDHDRHLGRLTTQTSPTLREGFGIGADTAAEMLIIFGDNPDRIHSEAAFAKLCGACPIPASSGMTTGRHRLYRGGHRQANAALHRAVIVRMRYHSPTLNYVERRTAEGRPKREIIRCLKRFLAREIFQRVMADYRARQAADLAA